MFRRHCIALMLLVYATAQARPGNSDRYPVGAHSLANGGAATALGKDPWHNPAGLGQVWRAGLSASVSAYGVTLEHSEDFVNAPPSRGVLDNSSLDIIPASLEYVVPLGERGGLRHGLGASVVMPDYDEFDGRADVPANALALEIRARKVSLSRTLWIVAGWGACTRSARFCVGAAPAFAGHQEKGHNLSTLYLLTSTGSHVDVAFSETHNVFAFALGFQVGLKLIPAPGLQLGLAFRTPMTPLGGMGSLLGQRSVVTDAPGAATFLDRVEVTAPHVEYRQPWRVSLGIGYEREGQFSVALDARYTAPLAPYQALGGPSGEVSLPPTLFGQSVSDPSRAFAIGTDVELDGQVNLAFGGEFYLTRSLALAAGVFTDWGAVSESLARTHQTETVSRTGAAIGVGFIGEKARTWLALVYARGAGSTVGLDATFQPALAKLESQSAMIMLGSSTGL